MSFGGEIVANDLLAALITGEDFTIPTVDLDDDIYNIPGGIDSALYQPVAKLTNAELTEKKIDGAGTFDVVMGGFRAQLVEEFNKGRISGAEYTKAFIALSESAMANAVQFLIARDQAFWQAISAQANGITARVALATAKVQYATAVMQARNSKAEYAVTKLRLATEDAQYGQAKYQIDNLLPAQLAQADLQNDIATFQRDVMLPLQQATQEYQLETQLPAQTAMVNEQKEAARAQTLNTRSDGSTTVVGVLGKQKDLYAQQITSYQQASKLNVTKLFTDSYLTIGAVGDFADGIPDQYKEPAMETMLAALKTENGLS